MLIRPVSPADETVGVAGGEPPVAIDYFVQLLAFDQRGDTFSTAHLGSWTTRSPDQAADRLRLFVRRACPHMTARAKRSATKWIKSQCVARKVRETLAGGAMYVHLIADGSAAYEISARPVILPSPDGERIGTWMPDETMPCPMVSGRWSW